MATDLQLSAQPPPPSPAHWGIRQTSLAHTWPPRGWAAFEERSFESFRSYYQYLPKGTVTMEYTVRLNNVGDFALPPSRVEALYAPEMFGEAPNARVRVEPVK